MNLKELKQKDRKTEKRKTLLRWGHFTDNIVGKGQMAQQLLSKLEPDVAVQRVQSHVNDQVEENAAERITLLELIEISFSTEYKTKSKSYQFQKCSSCVSK